MKKFPFLPEKDRNKYSSLAIITRRCRFHSNCTNSPSSQGSPTLLLLLKLVVVASAPRLHSRSSLQQLQLSFFPRFGTFAAMQSAQLPRLQIHGQFYGSGKELHGCVDNPVRVMRVITSRSAIRAGAATVLCEHDKERKDHVRGTATSHMRHNILNTSKVGLKKMNPDMLLAHYEFLLLASRILDEAESELAVHKSKSKKPDRLSTTSWDILE